MCYLEKLSQMLEEEAAAMTSAAAVYREAANRIHGTQFPDRVLKNHVEGQLLAAAKAAEREASRREKMRAPLETLRQSRPPAYYRPQQADPSPSPHSLREEIRALIPLLSQFLSQDPQVPSPPTRPGQNPGQLVQFSDLLREAEIAAGLPHQP